MREKRSLPTQNRYTDRSLILAIALLQIKVQSGFWLVLSEKSNSGFPVVNSAYEAATKLALPNVVLEEETDFLPVSP